MIDQCVDQCLESALVLHQNESHFMSHISRTVSVSTPIDNPHFLCVKR